MLHLNETVLDISSSKMWFVESLHNLTDFYSQECMIRHINATFEDLIIIENLN